MAHILLAEALELRTEENFYMILDKLNELPQHGFIRVTLIQDVIIDGKFERYQKRAAYVNADKILSFTL